MTEKKQLAYQPVILTVQDFTVASKKLLSKELDLVKGKTNLSLAYCELSPEKRAKSLIYRTLKNSFKLTINKYVNDKENTEDIISEALYLLKEASIKYFEKNRDYNFEQFAFTHIKEGIKGYRSKWNNLNSSDKNELIHTAIRIIKKKNYKAAERLNYEEAKHLAEHFNLNKSVGYKKIWELEALHFEKQPEWKKVDNGDGEEEIHITESFKKGNSLPNNINLSNNIKSHYNSPEIKSAGEKLFIVEENLINKRIIKKFFSKFCNNIIKKNIFLKRMYCSKDDEIKLKDLASLLSISIQRISFIEKNLREDFKYFFTVEKKKYEDIR